MKFQCHHCPKGVFGILVTHLMTPDPRKQNDSNTRFELIQEKIFKDHVPFEVISSGFHDEMSLTVRSSHLEINFFPDLSEDRELSLQEVCCNIREIVEASIIASLKDLHYVEKRVRPEMCFKCEDCHELHPVTKGKCLHRMYCCKTRKNSRIPPQGRCWFGEEGELLSL